MAEETLFGSSVVLSTNWTNASNATGSNNGTSATATVVGSPLVLALADLTETQEIETSSVTYGVWWTAQNGTSGRAQSALVELLDASDNVLDSFNTGTRNSATLAEFTNTFTPTTHNLALVNGYRVRVTPQEAGGMDGTKTHSVDAVRATPTYDVVAGDIASSSGMTFNSSANLTATEGGTKEFTEPVTRLGPTGTAAGPLGDVSGKVVQQDIASSVAMAFAGQSSLTAVGELLSEGTSSFGFAWDVNLTGAGELQAIGTLEFSGVSELFAAEAGPLASTGTMAFDGDALLDATGAMVANATIAFAGSSALSAEGNIQSEATVTFAGESGLSAAIADDIFSTADLVFSGISTLVATGRMSSTGLLAFSGSPSVIATGFLRSNALIRWTSLANLTEQPQTMSSTGALAFSGTSNLIAPLQAEVSGRATLYVQAEYTTDYVEAAA